MLQLMYKRKPLLHCWHMGTCYNYARKRQQCLSNMLVKCIRVHFLVQLKENCIIIDSLLACKTEHFRLCVCAVFVFSRIDGVRFIVPNGHYDLCTLLFWMTFIGTFVSNNINVKFTCFSTCSILNTLPWQFVGLILCVFRNNTQADKNP